MFQTFSRVYWKNQLLDTNKTQILFTVAKNSNCSRIILKHFTKNGQVHNLNLFPSDLKRVTRKTDPQLYVANEETATLIATAIQPFYIENVPFIEVKPGPCILSKALLHHLKPKKLGLIDDNKLFSHIQQSLAESKRSQIVLNTSKCYYKNISNFVLQQSNKKQWNDDVTCQMFINFKSSDISRHIVMDVIRDRKLFTNGRVEIFSLIPMLDFKQLTADAKSNYWIYTQKSCMFQLLFDYQVLNQIHKSNFLPWFNAKPAFGGHILYDPDVLNLIRFVPKKNLFSNWKPEDLPLLKFFVNQCLFKRTGYIIPKLEKWISGIGADLITAKFKENAAAWTNNTNQDGYDLNNLFHVFTECGSLMPHQISALFKFFQQLPQYKTSCFHQQYKTFSTMKK